MLWLAAPTFILLLTTMPETSGATILLHRAQRLRRSLGKDNLRSQSEITQAHMTVRQVAFDALISECLHIIINTYLEIKSADKVSIEPWEINTLDPAVLFSTFYSLSSTTPCNF
jgi:DHA1 family multidrug resistance protein-like MFS transporter